MSADKAFEQALANVPADCRCVQIGEGNRGGFAKHGDLFFGVSPGYEDRRNGIRTVELEAIPSFSYGVHFFSGAYNEDLVRAFVGSDFARRVNRLSFGICTYSTTAVPDGSYERIVETLAGGEYPKLDALSIGECRLFHNTEGMFGRLGPLDDLLAKTPNLTGLNIEGEFELHRPVDLPKLRLLKMSTGPDEWGLEPIPRPQTPASVANLFASNLPSLRAVGLDIEIEPSDDEAMESRRPTES
jgi:hypothetical protein